MTEFKIGFGKTEVMGFFLIPRVIKIKKVNVRCISTINHLKQFFLEGFSKSDY